MNTKTGLNFRAPQFITSAKSLRGCPSDSGAEVAFAGRSNTGKSSTLNALTGHARLAYVGKQPGRTRVINFFGLGNDQYRLVDLPGYGYAEVSKTERAEWWQLTKHFISSRRALRGIMLVVDSRHPMQDSDWNMIALAINANVRIYVLLNRADQLRHHARLQSLRRALQERAEYPSALFIGVQLFSATRNIGIDEARATILMLMST